MRQSILAGVVYFGCVFATGFVLGVVRMIFVAPLLGDTVAVALELPIILAVAWIVCIYLTRRFRVPLQLLSRVTMGALAFILLMVGELSLSVSLVGRNLVEHAQLYRHVSHMLGLAGQIAFALFPILQGRIERPSAGRGKRGQ